MFLIISEIFVVGQIEILTQNAFLASEIFKAICLLKNSFGARPTFLPLLLAEQPELDQEPDDCNLTKKCILSQNFDLANNKNL